jgi:glycosyltransferase involved in cell wall biosynthesis
MVLARRGSSGAQVVPLGLGTAPGPLAYALATLHLPQALLAARTFRPDAIYERFSAHGLGVMLGAILKVPVVSMVLDTKVVSLTLKRADRLITTAPQLIPSEYQNKVVRVHWGANAEVFRPDIDGSALRARLGFGPEDFVFGYTGAFYPWHGLEVLVDTIAKAQSDARTRRFKFLLVGDGEQRAAIEAHIERAGLKERFVSVGRVPYENVPEYIAACDACLAAYDPNKHPDLKRHGMFFDPLKVFEYLACAKPTVTLDSANMREIFRDQEHALLVPPGDGKALLDSLIWVSEDPARARAMGEKGRELVTQHYSWQAHGDHLTRIFRELVEKR